MIRAFFAGLWLLVACSSNATPIIFWHSLAGDLRQKLQALVNDFNVSHPAFPIQLVYKGEYTETLTSFAAAYRAGKAPAIIQVFEVGTAVMLNPAGIIKPFETLMQEQNRAIPIQDFSPAIRNVYSDHNVLQALPFNNSLPVLYYNKEALATVGISSENFPTTWTDLAMVSHKLINKGYACAYTTTYPAWILLEAYASLQNISLIGANGQADLHATVLLAHLKRLKEWQQQRLFEYGGRANDAMVLFTSKRCAMLSQSSGSYIDFATNVGFTVGVAALPQEALNFKARNNVVGGAALWTVAGQAPAVEHQIAEFYQYLLKPSIQQRWFEQTGYLPIGTAGAYQIFANNKAMPTLNIAAPQLNHAINDLKANNLPLNQIRNILDEELETIFANQQTPVDAMNNAEKRINLAIKRFKRNTHIY